MMSDELLPAGTRIKFNKYLGEGVCEDCPAITFANEGDDGEITGHGCKEGYWVKRDVWPNSFGCEPKDFDVLADQHNSIGEDK